MPSLGKILLAFILLHFVLQGQIFLLLQVSLHFLFCIPVPYDEKDIFFFFLVLVLEYLVYLHKTIKFSFFGISNWGMDLDYCDNEWAALEMNRDHSVVFEIAPKYCISDSFVDCKGYSILLRDFCPQ